MCEPGTPVSDLDTPVLIVDLDKVEANLRRGAEIAAASGVQLRPHAKTHKSPYFAAQQIAHGAAGIAVATLSEAEVMVAAGIRDVFLANVIVGAQKVARAVGIASRAQFSLGIDCVEQAEALSGAIAHTGHKIGVLIEVDTGAGRGGVPPDMCAALGLAVRGLPGIDVLGVFTYEGYTYSACDRAALRERLVGAHRLLTRCGSELRGALGIEPIVSAGSTPGLLSGVGYGRGITETRAGTYIFLDGGQAQLAGGTSHCAAHVLASVISRPAPDRAVLDCGSKVLTSDTRPEGVTHCPGYGLLVDFGLHIKRLSEEHAVIEEDGAAVLRVGEKVRILPNHICPVVNLFARMVCIRNARVERTVPVGARERAV